MNYNFFKNYNIFLLFFTLYLSLVVGFYFDENLNYAIDDYKTTYDQLSSDLQNQLNNSPNATVSIRGDKNIRYEDVMNVVMMADKLGAKVVLALDGSK